MSYETILTDRDGSSFVITLNRPDRRNAVSLKCMDEIMAACAEAASDEAVRAVIITGGMEYFSAGADLNEARAIKGPKQGIEYFNAWHRLNASLETLDKPVIAAIEGFCMTGGCELALACDLRVAAEGASFAITSSKIGTVAGAGGTQRLPRVVGPAKALEILFAAEPIDAAEAHRIGLINRLTPKGGALAEAKAMVKVYEQRAPLSLAFVKRVVHRGMQMDLASAIEFETFLVTTIYGTEDRMEGIGAFLEKRQAQFKGR
ncbi:enoyl-CoA hydratase/carnithine racemase [Rhodoligotrophos appendicifer]|uniref:enoyl-CoA hydratase/isomerase family protein n=1 Tax=Rhodoligotrophos appendicifer TaxID=987056 RepID=UPI001185A057|nr:enoyl-CoA hydratase/isomerase family protein [Rhodoligotrophos appendicifer]